MALIFYSFTSVRIDREAAVCQNKAFHTHNENPLCYGFWKIDSAGIAGGN